MTTKLYGGFTVDQWMDHTGDETVLDDYENDLAEEVCEDGDRWDYFVAAWAADNEQNSKSFASHNEMRNAIRSGSRERVENALESLKNVLENIYLKL